MSSAVQAPSRSLLRALKSKSSVTDCRCSRSKRSVQISQQRCQSTASAVSVNYTQHESSKTQRVTRPPRWAQTPDAMKAPVRTRPTKPGWVPFECNSDPDKLDNMYAKFLGKSGPKMLSDETKWLAITHKSFDFGRRGFNDRLSFLGRQIVELQTSLELLNAADVASEENGAQLDSFGRQPFFHPATASAQALSKTAKQSFASHRRMAWVAAQYGIPEVIRWLPRKPDNLEQSGSEMVYAQALYAIVGALALEQGALVANRVARERILQPIASSSGAGAIRGTIPEELTQ